ncbi:MAG: hypothetical protein KF773_12410 [Deltaproteobacteria bacterium]|nr:hypothetical protein [Deltaproteobacteria bacterium]
MQYVSNEKQGLFWTDHGLFRTYVDLGTLEIDKLECALYADDREEVFRSAFVIRVLVFGLRMLHRERPPTDTEVLAMRALRRQCDDALAPFLGAVPPHVLSTEDSEVPWTAVRIVLWRVLDTFDGGERTSD